MPEPLAMPEFKHSLLLPLLLAGSAASAQTVQLCPTRSAPIAPDGRVLGHLPYGEASPGELVDAPPGFAEGRGCKVRRDLVPDLERLLAAMHAAPDAGGRVVAISCFRGIARQEAVFCGDLLRDVQDGTGNAARAISVGPPGHSEHATGYAIDFGVRPANGCRDAEACMAATPAAKWLRANAPRYGFELSFPPANTQTVKWEPWHWRWVGTDSAAPGAARARGLFARARRTFPASPAVDAPPTAPATPVPTQPNSLPATSATRRP